MKLNLFRIIILSVLTLSVSEVLGQSSRIEIGGRGNMKVTYTTSTGLQSTNVEHRGKIVFNESDTDVESISSGGFLKISQRTFGTRRTVLLEGRSDGSISRTYMIGGREEPWKPEGAEWFADVLLDVIRSSGLGAETRVARFYKKDGVEAIIDEIEEISSDYVKAIYFSHSVQIDGLSTRDLNALITEAGDEIGSDFELSRFYIENSDRFIKEGSSVTVLLQSTNEISSDFEQARVLKHFIKEHDLTNEQLKEVIKASGNISSDFEQAGVLIAVNQEAKLSEDVLREFLEATEDISSDFESGRVLKLIIKDQDLTPANISMIINASNEISSDFEQAGVLKAIIGLELTRENLISIAEATKNISSDFEKSGVLMSILNKNKLDNDDDLSLIINASKNISSDFEQARVLNLAARQRNLGDKGFISITEATDNISSSFEKSRVLKTLIRENDLNKAKSLALLKAIGPISSNFEKAGILTEMGPKLPGDNEVIDAFRSVAKTITSDHDYGRVMRSVDF